MPQNFLPVKVATDIERNRTWDEVSKSPNDLLNWIAKQLAVDASLVFSLTSVTLSPSMPQGNDRMWVKTSEPVGIGVPFGNSYKMIFQYPVGVPLLWTLGSGSIPVGMREIATDDLDDYGLTAPGVADYVWVIFEPDTVTL